MTTETKEYAQLAAMVYTTTPRNELIPPPGWEPLEIIPDLSDGFSAGVFRRIGTTEIVIAYTGTNASKIEDTAFGNLPAATGQPSSQVLKAMVLYERIKNTPVYGDNITFTGHSLGGGLASLMAVYFNKHATTFDAAPFQLSALNSNTLNYYKSELASRGYVDGNFNQYNDASYPLSPSTFSAREANVTGYHLKGEFLNPTRNDLTTIYGGAKNEIRTGPTALSAFQLHSMVLLSATQWSTSFASAIQANSTVLNLVFDKNLYFKNDEIDSQANFLNLALNSEVKANGAGSQGMLTYFANDLQTLGTNLTGLNKAAQDAIIAQGIEWYYWQTNNYAGKQFFAESSATGLLQYTTAQGDKLADAQEKAKTWITPWLTSIVQPLDAAQVQQFGADAQWNVSATRSGITAAAKDASKKQHLIGNAGIDTFEGGSQKDMLFGGAGADNLTGGGGDDTLVGGIGNDYLSGGADNDTYIVGGGQDTLMDDAAGLGSVRTKDGVTFAGGSKDKNATGVWKNGNIKYVQKGTNLVIIQNNDVANSTVIKEFDFVMAKTSSYVGIALRDDDGSGGGGSGGTGGTGGISGSVGSSFTDARNWVTPRDPLILDLDADGIELSPTRDAVLFDHNADGIKTGSQWAKADDGMLVRDLDGNGLIDSGRELFGDQTLLSTGSNAGKTAANGFEALSQLDSNADQVFDANDAAYAELKLWRDLNQDGISQADELQTLSDAGITAISLDAQHSGHRQLHPHHHQHGRHQHRKPDSSHQDGLPRWHPAPGHHTRHSGRASRIPATQLV